MWRNLLAISGLLLSISVLLHSVGTASAGLGPVSSFGSNPVFSIGGYSSGSDSPVVPSQVGQEMVITDVTISAQYNHDLEIIFTTTSGSEIGRYKTWNYGNYPSGGIIDSHLKSGIRIAENDGLQITVYGSGSYTVSGFYAQP